MNAIKNLLRLPPAQRLAYGIGLTVWTYLLWEDVSNYPFLESSVGINYITLYSIPAAILALQVVINARVLWLLIFGLFSSYILISVFLVINDSIERSGNHIKAINWTIDDLILLFLTFAALGVINWGIYQIRPEKTG